MPRKREKSLAPLRSSATDSPVISVDERPSPRRYPLFFSHFPSTLLTHFLGFFLLPFFSSHFYFFWGVKTKQKTTKKIIINTTTEKYGGSHTVSLEKTPCFYSLTASTAWPSTEVYINVRVCVWAYRYIYSTGEKNGVRIYLHASGHPSKRRAAASNSTFFYWSCDARSKFIKLFSRLSAQVWTIRGTSHFIGHFPFITLLF